jgi:hypothetical protein
MKLFIVSLFLCASFSGFSQIKVKLSELTDHIGESVTTEGRVTDAGYDSSSSVTYLNVGGVNSKNSVIVLIRGYDRDKFTVMPEIVYKKQPIRVTGKVLNDNGKLEIIVYEPSQIVLLHIR